MSRKFTQKQLLLATANAGKVRELQALLQGHGVELLSTRAFNLEAPEETGSSFLENAQLKARYYGDATGLPALADDSGLCVEALDGKPGIHSARWAGPQQDFTQAMQRIQTALGPQANTNASFVCALALYWPRDGHLEQVQERVHGHLVFPPQGTHGFGYDPIFKPHGLTQTFAQLSAEHKQRLSHRTRALHALLGLIF